ncbi:MAG TPA: PHP domain-containing protein [Candidatus Parcubacteria bacterium]|jgi:HisJ family histidinol phosphate phosphatase|nr:hypothetical protein [Parcubacteria group bacterium]HJN62264.1 PHP domain-containing protein [Candidatus Parcubacteria bacterium]|tara:strand:+ start:57556 stop:58227 length:672 start_codon:yes stop_codon:yes gene_type:complete
MTNQDTHLHSKFSYDGENSIEEMVKTAIKLGLKEIAFTEHVEKNTKWVDKFVKEIKRVQRKYPQVKIYSGIEAKVIDLNGNIDATNKVFKKVDLVLGSFHRIPKAKEKYLVHEEILSDKKRALHLWYRAMIELQKNKNVDIIAHPTAMLKKYEIRLPNSMKKAIVKNAKKYKKVFEFNKKYKVPDKEFLSMLRKKKVKITYGSDSHNIKNFLKSYKKKHNKLS